VKNILKYIYLVIPFKKYFFILLRMVWSPSEKVYQHFHFKGTINIPIDLDHSFKMMHYGYILENDVFWSGLTGGWEKISLSLWIKLSSRSNVIIDIGANTGIYSLISKCMNPKSNVYAFEPVDRVYEKLVFNNNLNNFNITTFQYAISNYTGTAEIFDTDTEHTYSVTVNKNRNIASEKVTSVKINTITLDDFISINNISHIDLIKIDVETHEPEVLEGYSKNIKKHKPTILIEVLNDEIGEKIESIVKPLNYLYFNIGESKGIRLVEKITQSDHFNYLLCSEETAIFLKLI
jgi:FkbM family methyltransferase